MSEEVALEELEELRADLLDFWEDYTLDANIGGKLQVQVFKESTSKFIMRLRATFLGERVETVSVPADWWQGVRERWLPTWWLRKHPIEYTKIQVIYVCPHLQVPAQEVPFVHLHWLKKNAEPFEEAA